MNAEQSKILENKITAMQKQQPVIATSMYAKAVSRAMESRMATLEEANKKKHSLVNFRSRGAVFQFQRMRRYRVTIKIHRHTARGSSRCEPRVQIHQHNTHLGITGATQPHCPKRRYSRGTSQNVYSNASWIFKIGEGHIYSLLLYERCEALL